MEIIQGTSEKRGHSRPWLCRIIAERHVHRKACNQKKSLDSPTLVFIDTAPLSFSKSPHQTLPEAVPPLGKFTENPLFLPRPLGSLTFSSTTIKWRDHGREDRMSKLPSKYGYMWTDDSPAEVWVQTSTDASTETWSNLTSMGPTELLAASVKILSSEPREVDPDSLSTSRDMRVEILLIFTRCQLYFEPWNWIHTLQKWTRSTWPSRHRDSGESVRSQRFLQLPWKTLL